MAKAKTKTNKSKAKGSVKLEYYKPTQAAALKTFNRILKVSLDIIEQENVNALNTNRVALDCGINIGTLYHYFPNKDVIILALYQDWSDATAEISLEHRKSLAANTNPKRMYKKLILDLMNVKEYSCKAAVELERAMKLRKELFEVDAELTSQSIQFYKDDMAILAPEADFASQEIQPPFILMVIWGAITIGAEANQDDYDIIAENASEMIAALIRKARKSA